MRGGGGGAASAEAAAGAERRIRTPHSDVGNNRCSCVSDSAGLFLQVPFQFRQEQIKYNI